MNNLKNSLKLVSWNINGIRAAIKKGLWAKLNELDNDLGADFYGFQEIKCSPEVVEVELAKENQTANKIEEVGLFDSITETGVEPAPMPNLKYDYTYHTATNRAGYSGVLVLQKNTNKNIKVIEKIVGTGDETFDVEGRLTGVKFEYLGQDSVHKLALLNGYYPQGGRGPHRIEYKIQFYKKVLEMSQKLESEGFGVILCGDFNTTVADIDLARPAQNRKTTGCLPEEREALQAFFDAGYVDTFRHFYPDTPDKYSYWDQISRARERNVGWRIDYFLISQKLLPNLKKAEILDQILGSDHCPVLLELEF